MHLDGLPECPFLPTVAEPLRAADMKRVGASRGLDFYELALRCAQSLWRQGLPAQALLLINRAMGADLHEMPRPISSTSSESPLSPLPYAAVAWVLQNRREEDFIGNPRRHYQHLATRMVEPRKTIRSWRAWACWHLTCLILPEHPADEEQLVREGLVEPSASEIYDRLGEHGLRGEADIWDAVAAEFR